MKSLLRYFLLFMLLPATSQAQNVYVVNSLDDLDDLTPGDGVCRTVQFTCTLRAAFEEADATPNGATPDVIAFDDIPAINGISQIDITEGVLPFIHETVIIDAETTTNEVRIYGSAIVIASTADGTMIRGLTLGNFSSVGIQSHADDIVVVNNYIGITRSGLAIGCIRGIYLVNIENARIGGIDKGNVIGNCTDFGLGLWDAENSFVRGNYIGIHPDGREAPNFEGMYLSYARNTIVGGPTRAYGNLIAYNSYGIYTDQTSLGLKIRNNYIGTNQEGEDLGNGTGILATSWYVLIGGEQQFGNVIGHNHIGINLSALANKIKGNFIGTNERGDDLGNRHGITVQGKDRTQIGYAHDELIPLTAEEANVIAYNEESAIQLIPDLLSNEPVEIAIRGNQIYQNGSVGIDLVGTIGADVNDIDDLDSGPNGLINYPDIIRVDYNGSFDAIGIEYSISSDSSVVAYPLTVDAYIADDSVGGEGKTYIGSTTYATQNSIQILSIPATSITWAPTDVLVLTTTDADGNTSEFSPSSNEIGGPGHTVSNALDLIPSKLEAQYKELPSTVELSGNYPNPFRSHTMIAYQIPHVMDVILTVYDTNGALVSKYAYSNMSAGSHEILFDANELSSGIYFYRLQTDRNYQTGKMILLR